MFKCKAALRLTRSAQTSPAHRLTTPLRLLRSSDRFLQSHISLLSPFPESILKPSAPLPAHSQPEMLLTKWGKNVKLARLEGFPLRKPSGRALLLEAIYSLTSVLKSSENSPISRKILRGWRMARGAFGRGLVKLKVPDTDVRAGGALV